MVLLADGGGLGNKRVHRRIKNRFQTDAAFDAVRLRVASHRERGPYRVVAETNPRTFLGDSRYPTQMARLEIGFDLQAGTDHDWYWFNWIEPERSLLLGWHQDDDHPEHGPVHLQVTQSNTSVDHKPAQVIEKHPMAVVAARLDQLPDAIDAIRWENGTVVGLEW